jgi:mannose-6-phosphate isomerase-like protein (cupin superfamily)
MHTKLTDVLASHEGEDSWRHQVVDDKHLRAAYVQMAPGESSPVVILADHRTSFIVWDGEIEVSIGDDEPFVATKGFMIQVPFRVPFSMKNIGDGPSLHFEIFNANSTLLYPEEAKDDLPEIAEGQEWYLARIEKPDTYARQNSKPYLDFFWEVENTEKGPNGAFTQDDRSFVNIIRGKADGVPPSTDIGHFHTDYAEFWFVMEGQISYLIEGAEFFVADPGDVVYVPPGRFHRASYHGDQMSTRIAINGYPFGAHLWPTPH